MAKISKIKLPNNTTYDVYGENVQTINWTDYQNLPSDKKTNSDIAYFISDVPAAEQNKGIIKDVPNLPASTITFNDGAPLPMPKLEVAVEPQQDLHGYDAPWVGGAGKNKCKPISGTTTEKGITITPQSDGSIILNGTKTTDDSGIRITGIYATVANQTQIASIVGVSSLPTGIEDFGFIGYGKNSFITPSSSYSDSGIQLFINQGTTLANVRLYPQIEMGNSRTSYEPYSNICPISGWSAVDLTKCGANIWDEEWEVGQLNYSTGNNITSSTDIRSKNYIPCLPNTQYYIKCSKATIICGYDKNKNYVDVLHYNDSNKTFSTLDSVYYIRFCTISYGTTYNNDISINYPSTDTEYHAYNGSTITIQLGSTYYGGKLDVVSGVLTVNKLFTKGTTVAQVGQSGSGVKYADTTNMYTGLVQNALTISDRYIQIDTSQVGEDGKFRAYNGVFTIYDNRFTDITTAQSYLNDVEFCYELATPTTIQLTPTQVNSLEGVNNVWADTGDVVEASYVRDATSQLRINDEIIAGGNVAGSAVSAEFANNANYAKTADSAKTISGTVGIANGGTGATTAANARTKLGLGNAATKNTTDTYSSIGTNPTTGKAVAAALGTLDVTGASNIGAGKTISAWSETDGKVSISTQDINGSTVINNLTTEDSNAQRTDYIVAQYAGGGTTTTTYHRRPISKLFAAMNSSDVTTALGYTPYNSTNPNGYTSNTGTVTSVKVGTTSYSPTSGVVSLPAYPTTGTAAAKNYTSSVTSGSTDLVTSGAVYTAIDNLPEPMVFKGTVGSSSATITWANLPSASSSNTGHTYKADLNHSTAPICKSGDTIISNGSSWVVIPSGDEPSGTVTSVAAGTGLNGGTITSSGTLSVKYGTTSGTACQGNDSRLSDSRTPTSHTHGNIQNGGTLQTSDITIANGDKLVVTDSSDSAKVARSSIAFDGSTTTKALTQKGTFETFLQSHQDISGKADKSATVSTVAYDTTNKKFTKTINGTTSDVAKLATTSIGSASNWSTGTVPTLGTAISADDITAWSAGTTPTLGTAISADDITAWTTNTPTRCTIANGVLTFTAGASASLSYTSRSIPNVTSVGTKPSLSYTSRSIPNVTSVGTAPSLTISSTTVATGFTTT